MPILTKQHSPFSGSWGDYVSGTQPYDSALYIAVNYNAAGSYSISGQTVYRDVFAYIRNSSGATKYKTTTGTNTEVDAITAAVSGTACYSSHDAWVNDPSGYNHYIYINY